MRIFAAAVICLLAGPVLSGAYAAGGSPNSRSANNADLLRVAAPVEGEQELAVSGEEALAVESEAEEQEEREAEAEGQEASPRGRRHPTECVVPAIAGGTLPDAHRALLRAHCSLGKVSAPHSRHGSLVVVWQSRPRGSHLTRGSAVSVRLAVKPARPARRASLR